MITTSETVNKQFKLWMAVTLGLIKDGKMGVSQARTDRIKSALTYTCANKEGNYDETALSGSDIPFRGGQ